MSEQRTESRPLSRTTAVAEQLAREVARLTYELRVQQLSAAAVADADGTEDENWTVDYTRGEMRRALLPEPHAPPSNP